jgi:hypothetical protein
MILNEFFLFRAHFNIVIIYLHENLLFSLVYEYFESKLNETVQNSFFHNLKKAEIISNLTLLKQINLTLNS